MKTIARMAVTFCVVTALWILAAPAANAYSSSGSGGTASSNGCKTATVTTERKDSFGTLVFRYKTWTYWCWRNGNEIYNVSNGKSVDTGLFTDYKEQTNLTTNFYQYKSGYARSGYVHDRQVKFGNCPWFGCVEYWYPRHVIRAHSNGTYTWSKSY